MKYKIGDKVKIRSDLVVNTKYWNEDKSDFMTVLYPMLELKGKTLTINNIYEDDMAYNLEEDEYGFIWVSSAFENEC